MDKLDSAFKMNLLKTIHLNHNACIWQRDMWCLKGQFNAFNEAFLRLIALNDKIEM